MTNYIWVTFNVEGIHHWENAPEQVEYLKHPHRHIFSFKIYIEVKHNDRDIEFHMFKRFMRNGFYKQPVNFGNMSCEMISDKIYKRINKEYPNRKVIIEISEDGENGITKTYP